MKIDDSFFVHPDVRGGLVGEWELGQNLVSPVIDLSGNGNNGVITGASRVDGLGGHKVLSFDGIDDCIELDEPIVTDIQSVTISALIKVVDLSGLSLSGGQISNKYISVSVRRGAYLFGVNSAGYFQTRYFPSPSSSSNEGVFSSEISVIGKWYYVVFTNSGGVGKLYVNGLLNDTNELMTDMYFNEIQRINNVKSATSGYSFLKGDIANVRFYNKALSLGEIKALYIFFHKKYGLKPDFLNQ